MKEKSLGVILNQWIVKIRPGDDLNPRHRFQLRFFMSACVLALVVAALSLPITFLTEERTASMIIIAFAVSLIVLMAVARFGVSVPVLIWLMLGSVTLFLTLISITSANTDAAQLPWFILVPLAARAFTAPRIEDASPQPTARVTLIATAIAMLGGTLVVMLHEYGITFNLSPGTNPSWALIANFGLFLFSALGLVMLYDVSAQVTINELQRVRDLLAICAWCRKIHSDDEWITLETYTSRHTNNDLTHGICPTCSEREFPRRAE